MYCLYCTLYYLCNILIHISSMYQCNHKTKTTKPYVPNLPLNSCRLVQEWSFAELLTSCCRFSQWKFQFELHWPQTVRLVFLQLFWQSNHFCMSLSKRIIWQKSYLIFGGKCWLQPFSDIIWNCFILQLGQIIVSIRSKYKYKVH